MVTILDKLSPSAELGERFGRGTASALQSLVDAKLSQLHKQAGLMETMDPQQSQMLSQLPDNLFNVIAPQFLKNQQYQQGLAAFGGDQNKKTFTDTEDALNANETGYGDKAIGNKIASTDQQRIASENARTNQAAKEAYILSHGNPAAVEQAIQNEKNRILKESQFQVKEERETRKELEPFTKIVQSAKDFDFRTLGTIRAAQSGQLRTGDKQIFMEKVGLGEAFRNPVTQAGQKDLEGFALGVAQAFGPGMGRIMQKEFDAFIKSNANKFNDPEVIDYIGQNNLLKNKVVYEKQKERIKTIKANNNRIPIDLEDQVEKNTSQFQKETADKMLILNNLFSTGKLKEFKKNLNPARFTSNTVIERDGIPFKIEDGVWMVDFSRLNKE